MYIVSGKLRTIAMDRMGYLHIWDGKVSPVRVGKYQYDAPIPSIYFQDQADVEWVLDCLSADDVDSLQNGYIVSVRNSTLEEICNG